jgi:ATP-dependent DNA helicase RecQ
MKRMADIEQDDRFYQALRRYWGYETFRPRQEEIVRSIAAGRDACVVMPTGGGKSLCYQLPAALAGGRTAVVISPLIALMQDQVAHLTLMGIPAVFLNSATAEGQRSDVKRRAAAGEYRLLYLSPERVVLDGTAEWLTRVPVSFFAIDEAHCISEWGHDFRPEYRQLSKLREMFPESPIAAFTASATQHVRHDIIKQLRLRDPFKHIASFRRPNLRYVMHHCAAGTQDDLLLDAICSCPKGNIIVYAPTIARVGEVAQFLNQRGIAATSYHGQMDAATRKQNQERWMTDELRVLVGTMAFGLGINKAGVRAVIHLSLPKSIEQYYQEAGRAGRDGLPADCFLLWQKKDAALHAFFINQVSDAQERDRAWRRYHDVRDFVDSAECRQLQICRHFGETPRWDKCGQCDVCGYDLDWLAAARADKSPKMNKQAKETLRLLGENRTLPEIARIRGVTLQTVAKTVSEFVAYGTIEFQSGWVAQRKQAQIEKAWRELGSDQLSSLKEALPDNVSYDEIRLVVAHLRAQHKLAAR